MVTLSRALFGIACLALMLLAGTLIGYGAFEVVRGGAERFDSALLDAVGYVVIAIAIFDVAKYLIEEEVIRAREMRHITEPAAASRAFSRRSSSSCSSRRS